MNTIMSIAIMILIGIGVLAAVIGLGILILFGISLYHMAKVMQNRGL